MTAMHRRGSPPCGSCSRCCYGRAVLVAPDDELWNDPRLLHLGDDGELRVVPLTGSERRCIFLENGRCSVYGTRPAMCREFDCRALVRLMGGDDRRARKALARRSDLLAMGVRLYSTLPPEPASSTDVSASVTAPEKR